jgi:hypothetical protein
MIFWKCKYYNACGSPENCKCCRERPKQQKEDLNKLLKTIRKEKRYETVG